MPNKLLCGMAATLLSTCLFAQIRTPPIDSIEDQPIRFTGDTLSDRHYYDGRLRHAVGAHNYQAFRANRSHPPEATGDTIGWTYSHQPYLAYWNSRFFLQYLSNPHSEHVPPGRTLLMTSEDGIDWSPPRVVFPEYALPRIDRDVDGYGRVDLPEGTYSVMHQRMGFYVAPNGRLLTSGFYALAIPPEFSGPTQGIGVGRVVREIHADGSLGPIHFIRFNRIAGWNEENTAYPLYTESGDEGFRQACEALLADPLVTLQWQEEDGPDPDFYAFDTGDGFSAFAWAERPDGSYLGVMKDNLASLSADGVHWTEPARVPSLHTSNAKVWVERTVDDRYALVYNHSATRSNRFPMVVLTSDDAHEFDNPLLINGEVSRMRFMGFEKNSGSQYFRGITPGNGKPPGDHLWVTYSVNKEDIWVSRTPVPIRGTVDRHVSQDFEELDGDVSRLQDWNMYLPRWAPASIGEDPAKAGNHVLRLYDSDPWDYPMAFRVTPENELRVNVSFDVFVERVGNAHLFVEVHDRHGTRPTALRFDGAWLGMDRGAVEPPPLPLPAGKWTRIQMDLDVAQQRYVLHVDGEAVRDLPFAEPVKSLERLVFRTGPWRGDVRAFIVDGEPGAKGIYKEDLPGADSRTDPSAFLIDNVSTQ